MLALGVVVLAGWWKKKMYFWGIVALIMAIYLHVDAIYKPAALNAKSVKGIAAKVDELVPENKGKLYEFIEDGVLAKGDPVHYFEMNFYLHDRVADFYKDKPSIIEYFQDHNIHISFMNVHNPDIEISKDSAYVGSTKIQSNKKDLWEDIDQYCVSNKIYDRNYISDYIPSYKNNTFFLVVDYGLSSQLFDSKPMTMSVAHKKGMSIAKELPSIKSIDVVNSTTLQVVEHFNMELQEFEPATEEVFLNVML